jgi:hypothetical protein
MAKRQDKDEKPVPFGLPGVEGGKGGDGNDGGDGGDGNQGKEDPQPLVGELLTEVEIPNRRRAGRTDPRFGQVYEVRFHMDVWQAILEQGWFMAEDETADGGHVRIETDSKFTTVEAVGVDGTSDIVVTCTPHTRRHDKGE